MEKILMNDVINLVKESIKREFKIECSYRFITIYNKERKIDIIQGCNNGKEVLAVRTTNLGRTKEIELSEEDALKWKLLKIECDNYQNNIALKDFNKFFEEDNNIPININDLDNDEE